RGACPEQQRALDSVVNPVVCFPGEELMIELRKQGHDRESADARDDLGLAARPAAEFLEDTGRLDDVALKEALQVVGQFLGGGIAVLGHLFETFQADGLELTRKAGDELMRGNRVALEDM